MRQWNKEMMKKAVLCCRNGLMGFEKASKMYNVPKTTLVRYVRSTKHPSEVVETKMGRSTILPPQLEKALADHCIEMERRYFGLTRTDVRTLAYYLCKINRVENPFSKKDGMAGRKWLKQFLARHKNLSIRKAEALSLARGKGFNPKAVAEFFEIYEPEYFKVGGDPSRIYNCDETGVTNVQSRMPEVSIDLLIFNYCCIDTKNFTNCRLLHQEEKNQFKD